MERINGAGTIDIGGGRQGFRSEDLPTGTEGTEVTDLFLNMVQEELLAIIECAGMVPSDVDWAQAAKAIQSGKYNYAVAGGTANALSASLVPVPLAYSDGLTIHIKCPLAGTGAATLNVNGLGVRPIVRRHGGALQSGDIAAGAIITVVYDESADLFRLDHLVASDINLQVEASKSPFNLVVQSIVPRTSLSGTGFVAVASGIYTKKSATSNLLVKGTTNVFSTGGTAAGQMRVTVGAQEFTVICVNMTSSSNAASPNGSKLMTGLPQGDVAWLIEFGRTDALAWASILNPNSSDSTNLPPSGTITTIEFMEIEP